MIALGACALLTILAWWAGPRLLTSGRWQVRYPSIALAAWHAALGFGLLTALGAVGCTVALALQAQHTQDAVAGVIYHVAGWGALAALGAVLLIVGAGSDGLVGAGERTFGEVLALPHTKATLDGRVSLLTCRSDEPFACAIPGRDAAVVVSSALREILTPAQLSAVVAHELAHLRGRHYMALRIAELHRACLPSSRRGKQLLRATTFLVELIADDAAARRVGAVHLANALVHVADQTQDLTMELRAERLATRQWTPSRKLTTSGALVRP
ncbi:M56 family metallopeptidase [Microbacterium sp. CFBP 8790]|uniref:M48 family metalloprotease n=1 Tax=unclassified Microbacterium TaxID=2609290 RepID=UPI00177AC5C4|nr:M56 family metallopeptidase [Microbacterium sp. CFBP 8801]MBD8508695.1 M56 family metallopeptidase [Microbacterium sp. CFBP 8790]